MVLIALLSGGANPLQDESGTGYHLNAPDAILILPEILHEISGLTAIDSSTFACIQDENGILFFYDAVKNRIVKQYAFHGDGDYEGITQVDGTIYVLRSDGELFEISDYNSKDFHVSSYATGIPAMNNEGLCYDRKNNRLLIACKSKTGRGREYKNSRAVYGFDLTSKTHSATPVFVLDFRDIEQFAREHQRTLPLSHAKRSKPPGKIQLKPSAIGIHPLTGKIFLLSADTRLLLVLNRNGGIEQLEPLNPVLFNKAEGITFFNNGDMLISNEGQEKRPTVLRFHYGGK